LGALAIAPHVVRSGEFRIDMSPAIAGRALFFLMKISSGLGIVTSLEREPAANPAEIRRLARMGVDGIIADDVALLARVLNETSLSRCGGEST